MTSYERLYRFLSPLMPVHYRKIWRMLRRLCPGTEPSKRILDVGGRKSPYTIGVNGQVTIVDLPRQSEVQRVLALGLNDEILAQLSRNRSNIVELRLEDITKTTCETETYDVVVSVEVIEHVPDDTAYLSQIHRVLKRGGHFVLTTPNGQAKPNMNPDHVRHYRPAELETKLKETFCDVSVMGIVRQGFVHRHAIGGWVPQLRNPASWIRMPWRIGMALLANLLEGHGPVPTDRANQLFAIARKPIIPKQGEASDIS